MSDRDKFLTVVREWMDKADNDLISSSHILKLGGKCPTEVVCYHAQQCIEKYLKAVLVLENIDFPKTHNIKKLIALLPVRARPQFNPKDINRFAEYAVDVRYPGWSDITLTDARQAVALARRVRKEIRAKLPREVLRRRNR